jgi:hypothetical protein
MLNKDQEWIQNKKQRLLHELIAVLNWMIKLYPTDNSLKSKVDYIKSTQIDVLERVFLEPEGRQWITLFYKNIKDVNNSDQLLSSYAEWVFVEKEKIGAYLVKRLDLFIVSIYMLTNKSIACAIDLELDRRGLFPGINLAWNSASRITIQLVQDNLNVKVSGEDFVNCLDLKSFKGSGSIFFDLPKSKIYNVYVDLVSQVANINFNGREQLTRFDSQDIDSIDSSLSVIDKAINYVSQTDVHNASYFSSSTNFFVPLVPPEGALPSSSNSSIDTMFWHSFTDNPMLMAEIIVHELSHQKLFRLQDIDPLIDPTIHGSAWDSCTIYSPWRDDPRPINGVFHGFIVFAEACKFWYSLIHSGRLSPLEENISKRRFAMLVLQLECAYYSLLNVKFTSDGLEIFDLYKSLLFEQYIPFVKSHKLGELQPFFMEHHDEEELDGNNINEVVLKHKNNWAKRNSIHE